MPMQAVVGRDQIVKIFFACDRLLAFGVLNMASQIERETHATETRNAAGAFEVTLLTAAPSVHEQHARHLVAGRQEGARHGFIFYSDFNCVAARFYTLPP